GARRAGAGSVGGGGDDPRTRTAVTTAAAPGLELVACLARVEESRRAGGAFQRLGEAAERLRTLLFPHDIQARCDPVVAALRLASPRGKKTRTVPVARTMASDPKGRPAVDADEELIALLRV